MDAARASFDGKLSREDRGSDAVARLALSSAGQDLTVGAILDALQDRGFGLLMIVFALPNAIIPGISFILGAPVLLFALQLAFGSKAVWLPGFMERRKVSASLFQKIAARTESFLRWVEKRTRPRWPGLVSGAWERILGLYIAAIAAFLMLPVPFGNALPAIGISLMAVGLMERDGKAAAVGALLGLLGAIYIGVAIALGVEAVRAAIHLF